MADGPAALALTPPDAAFAAALDNAFKHSAAAVAQAADDLLLGSIAMAFQAQTEGIQIDAPTFLRLHHDLSKELAEVIAHKGTDIDRRESLGIAIERLATRLRGNLVLPLDVEA